MTDAKRRRTELRHQKHREEHRLGAVVETRADAHVWIAVYASRLPGHSPDEAITMADFAVEALREKDPETFQALERALA